jgi:hypothetical protein
MTVMMTMYVCAFAGIIFFILDLFVVEIRFAQRFSTLLMFFFFCESRMMKKTVMETKWQRLYGQVTRYVCPVAGTIFFILDLFVVEIRFAQRFSTLLMFFLFL